MCDTWKSPACVSPVLTYILSTCLYETQTQFNLTCWTLGDPPIYLWDWYHLSNQVCYATTADSEWKKYIFLLRLWMTLPEPAHPVLSCCKLTLGH